MGILGPAAEAPIRAALEVALPDRAAITRVTPTGDGHGGWTDQSTTFATGIPCRVDKDARYDREMVLAGRSSGESSFVLLLSTVAARWPGGVVDVRASDQIVITGDGAGTYEPASAGGPVSDEFVREIRVSKME